MARDPKGPRRGADRAGSERSGSARDQGKKWVIRGRDAVKDARRIADARSVSDAGKVRDRRAVSSDPRPKEAVPRTRSVPAGALLERQPWDLLEKWIPEGAEGARERLRRYAEALVTWNRTISNLISRNDEPRIVVRHIAESIQPARWLAESGARKWIDLGTGAGLPAIPLAIVGVGEHWTLVESRRTKTLFLRKVLEQLGIGNVEVALGRGETLVEEGYLKRDHDAITSRATLAFEPTLEFAESVVRQGGCAFLWKGERRDVELASEGWHRHWKLDETRVLEASKTAVIKLIRTD